MANAAAANFPPFSAPAHSHGNWHYCISREKDKKGGCEDVHGSAAKCYPLKQPNVGVLLSTI